jgi:mannose-1-phosphate guanylyltransferase/mannose-6-phosphate isomerase
MIIPVILSGGSGSRLWPLSRELTPKQLLPLLGQNTLLQATVERLQGLAEVGPPLVVCNEEHRFQVSEQLLAVRALPAAILLEPFGRNTAPAVTVAALTARELFEDPVLLVLPADHLIRDVPLWQEAVAAGLPLAEEGRLVTFGIVPHTAETGYGYIKAGASLGVSAPATAYRVASFVEKPDLQTASGYLEEGGYFWNSGMFMFRASVFLAEVDRWAPAVHAASARAIQGCRRDFDFIRMDADAFSACPNISVDHAVMERTAGAAVVPLAVGWSDIGSWSALWEAWPHDTQGNAAIGDVLAIDSANSLLMAGSRMLAVVGVENLVVVETADAVLVAHRDKVQQVRQVVDHLKIKKREEIQGHRRVSRPWGAYESIDRAERHQVKHLTVKPGASLSLQMHYHRAEHWIVVRGTARITRGEEVFTLSENQSTFIPEGVVHRLENPGRIPLEIIEVQSGSYLGEDDIVRFKDTYGRSLQFERSLSPTLEDSHAPKPRPELFQEL